MFVYDKYVRSYDDDAYLNRHGLMMAVYVYLISHECHVIIQLHVYTGVLISCTSKLI